MEDHDLHFADDQLAALGLHLSVLPDAVSGVILEHVNLRKVDVINNGINGGIFNIKIAVPFSTKSPFLHSNFASTLCLNTYWSYSRYYPKIS